MHVKTSDAVTVQLENGETVELDHGRVVIAAITSCTNTSNPSVMLGAGLVAKKAVERGLRRQPWVKTSLAPGSTVVTEYLERSGLDEYLDKLQFNLVGYGCTTCIGNSGPLPEEISKAVNDNDLVRLLRALGQSQLRGPDQPGYPRELPRLAAPGGCLRTGRAHGHRPEQRSARKGLRRRARLSLRRLAQQRRDQAGRGRRRQSRHVHQELCGCLHRRRALARNPGAGGRPLHLARLHLCPQAHLLRGNARGAKAGGADRGRQGSRGAGRLRHHGPHLSRGGDQEGQSRREVAARSGRRGPRLQLLWIASRQPRGDGPRDLRQRPAPQPARREGGRFHPSFPRR